MNTVTTIVAVLTLVMLIIGFIGIFYRFGKSEQQSTGRLEALEKEGVERDKRMEKMLNALTDHCKDEALHVNAKLQEHIGQEGTRWRDSVDNKLNLLLSNKKDG